MFKFLKDKIKSAVSIFSKSVKDETEAKEIKEEPEKVIPQEIEVRQEKKIESFEEAKAAPKKFEIKKEEKIEVPKKVEFKKEEKVEIPKRIEQPQIKKETISKPEIKKPIQAPEIKAVKKEVPEIIEKAKAGIKKAEQLEKEFLRPIPKHDTQKVERVIESPKVEVKKEEIKKPETKEPIRQDIKPKIEKIIEPLKDEIKSGPLPELKEEVEETVETIKEEVAPQKKGFFSRLFGKKDDKQEIKTESQKEVEVKVEKSAEETGIFGKIKETITKKTLTDDKFNELFDEFEMTMLENNVAFEVIEKIKNDLRNELVNTKVIRGQIEDVIESTLKRSIEELFDVEQIDLLQEIKNKKDKPFVIVFVGINGTGKTTTIAKIVNLFKKNKLTCCIAASDTFRAAAIQQLEEHANNLNVRMIKHDYGSDPAAVAFDAVHYAKAHDLDVVLVDTAGRLHSNVNLMDELKKIIRVVKPDMKIFIGDSLTGNDCVEQSTEFNNAVSIDAIILAKADADEKGGAALSVSYMTKKPIIYLGVGQGYDDLEDFDKTKLLERIGLA